jgi:hypothetical protein
MEFVIPIATYFIFFFFPGLAAKLFGAKSKLWFLFGYAIVLAVFYGVFRQMIFNPDAIALDMLAAAFVAGFGIAWLDWDGEIRVKALHPLAKGVAMGFGVLVLSGYVLFSRLDSGSYIAKLADSTDASVTVIMNGHSRFFVTSVGATFSEQTWKN